MPSARGDTTRRRLLHVLGACGLGAVAGCSAAPGTDSSPNDTTPTDGDSTPGTPTATATAELHDSATIGVDYALASYKDYSILASYTRTFEPLTWTTPELGARPWLAADWARTGNRTWEFTLRDGVRYHNGDRLTADRVLSMFEWALTDYGGLPLDTPRWANTTADGLRQVDELTFELRTIEPTVSQPANLAILTHLGVHPSSSLHTRNDYSALIGTGPYRITDVKENQHVKLAAFPEYWGGEPATRALTIRQFDDRNTLALALQGKEIDVGLELPASQFDPIKQAPDSAATAQPAPKTTKLFFDMASGPFTDASLRKAVLYAVSNETLIQATQNGLAIPARGPIPPMVDISAHERLPTYGPDRAKAKRLVERSGYDASPVTLVASGRETRSAKLVTQVLRQDLRKVGLEVDVQMVGTNAWYSRRDTGEGHLFLGQNTMLAPDEPFREALARYGSGGKDVPWLSVPPEVESKLDARFETARTTTGQTRTNALQDAQHIIMSHAFEAPLYHVKYVVGMRSGITGVDWHPLSSWSRFENLKYVK